jgi:hypothetical protein
LTSSVFRWLASDRSSAFAAFSSWAAPDSSAHRSEPGSSLAAHCPISFAALMLTASSPGAGTLDSL